MAQIRRFQYGGPSPILTELGNRTAERVRQQRKEEAETKRREFERDTELYKQGKLAHAYYAQKYFPHSEIVDGKPTGAGAISGADPVGSFAVGNVVASPLFKLIGNAALFTLGKMGNSWARNKLINRELNRAINQREINYADPAPVLPPKYAQYADAAKQSMENNIQTMAQEAKNYATSAERRALDARLNQEAHDLGYLGEGEQLQFYSPHNKPPTFKIFNDEIPGEDFGVNGVYDGYINQIRLTRAGAQGFTPFHETLHYFGIGQNPKIAQTRVGRRWYNARPDGKPGTPLEDVDAVYATEGPIQRSGYFRFDKIEQALDPERLKTLSTKDLTYIKSEELPVHGLTTGKQLGIKPFQEYPGDETMPGIIEKANTKNNWMSYVKQKTPQDFRTYWQLLTGSYLATLPFIYNK